MVGTIARVYAETMLRTADRHGVREEVDASLAAVVDALEREPRLRRFLEGPQIEEADKKAVLKSAFGGAIHPLGLRFLFLLVDKHRETLLEEIVTGWRELLDERAGLQSASVVTAVPVAEEVLDRIRAALERRTGKTVRLQHRIDPGLLGGMVVRAGDTVIDGSLRTRLRTLRRRLRAASAAPWEG